MGSRAFNETERTVKNRPRVMPVYKRHEAILEAMATVPQTAEAWVDLCGGLKVQLKDVQQLHGLFAAAEESEGSMWQLMLHYDKHDTTRPNRVDLNVFLMPWDTTPMQDMPPVRHKHETGE